MTEARGGRPASCGLAGGFFRRVWGTDRRGTGVRVGLGPAPGVCALLCFAWLLLAAPARAQRPADADTVFGLSALVVTADRAETPLATSIAAVSLLTAADLAALPHVTLADALRRVPGFAHVDFDGLGHDPQLMVRGFYGGGEAEYVVVLLDGKPMNDVAGGLVAWESIPLSAVERVEVLRGGASVLWGDAAVGGVINVITRRGAGRALRWEAAGGSHGTWRGAMDAHGSIGGRAASIFGGVDRTAGFRAHAERTTGRAGGSLTLASGTAGRVRLTGLAHWREFEEPGPLLERDLARDRAASNAFFRFDRTADRFARIGLDAERAVGGRARITASLSADRRDTESVRTVALAPDFGDTKARVLGTTRVVGAAQVDVDGAGQRALERLVLGVDASYAVLESEYFVVRSGDPDAYAAAAGGRGERDASGRGHRKAAAAFAQYTALPHEAVRLSAGVRVDWLRDAFEPRTPEAGRVRAAHTAVSPRLGANLRYLQRGAQTGHVYVTAGRSFKAPTPDQLFDQRRFPVPFPPFTIWTSNPLLEPQHGVSVEAGLFHGFSPGAGRVAAEASLSIYRMDMENELDFDLATFRYVNIGRSRHVGVEAGLRLRMAGTGAAFLNYTRQDVTSRAGEHAGRRLKAIPLHVLGGGLDALAAGRLEAGLSVSHARGTFLDDANTATLPPHTRVDARLSHPAGGLRVFLDVRNLFDARYSSTAYPDPGGSGAIYHHPAAGRTLVIGLRGGG